MDKKLRNKIGEYMDSWLWKFIPDKGDNWLEAEGQLWQIIEQLLESKWISVENELPKKTDYLLVVFKESVLYAYFDGKEFQVINRFGGYTVILPTFHQPLPQLPKE